MTKAQIATALQTIVRLQLDDCKRAIKDGTKTIALNELEDAIRQLKLLALNVRQWTSTSPPPSATTPPPRPKYQRRARHALILQGRR